MSSDLKVLSDEVEGDSQVSLLLPSRSSSLTGPTELNLGSATAGTVVYGWRRAAEGISQYDLDLDTAVLSETLDKVKSFLGDDPVFLNVSAHLFQITALDDGINVTAERRANNPDAPMGGVIFGVVPKFLKTLATRPGIWQVALDLERKRLVGKCGRATRTGKVYDLPDDRPGLVRFPVVEAIGQDLPTGALREGLAFSAPFVPRKSRDNFDVATMHFGDLVARDENVVVWTKLEGFGGISLEVPKKTIATLIDGLREGILPPAASLLRTEHCHILGGDGLFMAWSKPAHQVNPRYLERRDPQLVASFVVDRRELLTSSRIFTCGERAGATPPLAISIVSDGDGLALTLAVDHGEGCVCEHRHPVVLEQGNLESGPLRFLVNAEHFVRTLSAIDTSTTILEVLTENSANLLRLRTQHSVVVLLGIAPPEKTLQASRHRSRSPR